MTLAQLTGAGLSARQVERAVERGELNRLHRGVFLMGPCPLPHSAELAAVLACGSGAWLSHRSAVSLYEMLPYEEGSPPIHVTVAGGHRRGDPGIVVHETSSLRPYEVRERHGIPLTAPIRTLIDFAGICPAPELERAVAEAFALGLTNRAAVLRAVDMVRGRRGVARLIALLEGRPPARTRSAPERRLLQAIRGANLPEPETNTKVDRWEVDLLWRSAGLVVEVDGYSAHSSPRAFERDRRKDAELTALGLTVQRFTAEVVRSDLAFVVAWIDEALARNGR